MRRRRWIAGPVLAVALLLLAALTLWAARVPVFAWAAARWLDRQGLGPASFAVDAVDLQGLHAREVSLAGGRIKAKELTLAFSLGELRSGHLARVEIRGLSAGLVLSPDGGVGLGRPPVPAGGGSASSLQGLRIDALALADAHLSLATAAGPIEAVLAASLAIAGGEIRGSDVGATVTGPLAGTRRSVTITARELRLWPQDSAGARLTVSQASVAPQGLPWTADRLDGELLVQAGKAVAKLTIGRLDNLQKPALVAPLRLEAGAVLSGPHLDFTLAGESLTRAPARFQAKGRHELASGSGSAEVALAPLVFRRGFFQPGDLLPSFAGLARDVDGTVGLAGRVAWTAAALTPDLSLTVKDLALTAAGAELAAINGSVKVVHLFPPATAPGQSLSATILTAGLPPMAARLTGQLLPKPALKLDRIALDVAGGEISAAALSIDPAMADIDTTLKVDRVDLAQITGLLGVEGLEGTGRLDGRIPIALHGGQVAIAGGRLAAAGSGVLRYNPKSLPPDIAQAGESMALALQALSDFHYDKLALDLDKAANGEGAVVLHLEGSNPAVLKGHAFNVNIRIESNFDRLADLAMLSLRSAEELLRRAARRGP